MTIETYLTENSATNRATVRGVTVLNQTDDKSRSLNRHNLLIFAGETGDTIQFAEYVQANVQLYGMKNDIELNSDAVAAFTRREMADNLRSRVIYIFMGKANF
jgi:20S proteasome subunit beta 4